MSRKYVYFIGVALLALLSIAISGANYCWGQDHTAGNPNIILLRSDIPTDRDKAMKSIMEDRNVLIAKIEAIIIEKDKGDRKGTLYSAIKLLGDLHANEAIPLLVKHLTLEVFYKDTKRTQPIEDRYPAVGALIKIGLPALKVLLTEIEISNDNKMSDLVSYIFIKDLGPAVAKKYVEERLNMQQDKLKRNRLKVLIDKIDKNSKQSSLG